MEKEKGVVEKRMLEDKKGVTERTVGGWGGGGGKGEGTQVWNSCQKTRMTGRKKGVEK